MSGTPQEVLDLLNSLIHSYPTGLPEGIHLNINLDIKVDVETAKDAKESAPIFIEEEQDDTPQSAPVGPVYKGPFLGLYRVIAENELQRIKVYSDCDLFAPELSLRIGPRQLQFMRALNTAKPSFLENNGYIYTANDQTQGTYYRQYAFDGQLLVIAETRRAGKTVLGRIVGIGSDPLKSDPKPLDAAVTNNALTPWLVHQIPGLLVYAPILASETGLGWVCMEELEKIR